MKRTAGIIAVLALAATAVWAATVGDRMIFEGQVTVKDYQLNMAEISAGVTPPNTGEWGLYFTSGGLYTIEDDGTTTNITAGSGDNTLDNAYDQGGAGAGRTITADTGAVTITNTDADAAYLLSITPTPGSSAATGGVQITSGANSTQDSLNIVNSGSGDDIQAGNGAFTVSSAGAVVGTSFAGAVAATTLTASSAGTLGASLTLDDGSGASPYLYFIDGSDENASFAKANSGYLILTTLAADGVQVNTGNLAVGNGAASTAAMNGEDLYVEGELEVDGAIQLDGALTAASTVGVNGAATFNSTVEFSENVTFTVAADEYFQINAATTDNTTTAGVLDINFDSVTNGGEGANIKATIVSGGGGAEVVSGLVVDLDDDSDAAGTLVGVDINASDATGSSTIVGIRLGNALEDQISATVGAGNQAIVIDAASAINTGTAGVIDTTAILSEDTASFMNIDVESEADGAAEIVHGIMVQVDDDADNADNEIHGIHVQGDGTNGTGLQHMIVTSGANVDAALYAQTGYVRIGTGSAPGITPGDDDLFVEGTVEIDGVLYADGNITGDGATIVAGVVKSFESTAADNILTAAECGKVVLFDDATEFDNTLPAISAVTAGCTFKFIVGGAPSGDDYRVLTGNSLENVIYGLAVVNGASVAGAAEDTITFANGAAVRGDWVEVVTDGTYWYVSGQGVGAGAITLTQAD